ncbi:MAG TPA: hypothetical protein VFG28_15580 [Syntrophales bacterium]|nr:hypothetical protein [Syntrophales bacterium]
MNRMIDRGVGLRLVSNRGKAKNASSRGGDFCEELYFNEMLNLEKKRSRRSMRPLMLMQLDISGLAPTHKSEARRKLEQALASGIRETDVCGWFKQQAVVGIVFTELKSAASPVRDVLIRRVMARLVSQIDPDVLFKIKVSFHAFPEDEAAAHSGARYEMDWRKDLANTAARRDLSSRVKILKDVVGHFLMT